MQIEEIKKSKMFAVASKIIRVAYKFKNGAKRISPPSQYIDNENINSKIKLYKTKDGNLFWLNNTNFIDKELKNTGVWEYVSTQRIKNIVKKDFIVLDIGANFGYYTVIMSKLVGEKGKVLSFEPTKHYGNILKLNVETNNLNNVTICDYGLSDANTTAEIGINSSSATLHWINQPDSKETISLKRLDDVIDSLNINRLDFIKIDVDGHEPAFLKGAWKTIEKYKPVILMEVSHANYFKAGITAWDFYNDLKSRGLHVCSEKTLQEYSDLDAFLRECGNFNSGANILLHY